MTRYRYFLLSSVLQFPYSFNVQQYRFFFAPKPSAYIENPAAVHVKMSFLEITDPSKRDLMVEEFIKTRKNIQDSFITERLRGISAQMELSKLFKPVTDTQKDIKESLVKVIKPITEGIKLTAAITFPQLPALAAPEEEVEEQEQEEGVSGVMRIGKVAHQ